MLTAQLAEFYGTDANNINVNFSRNKEQYVPGEDYFVLEGKELKKFKSDYLTNCGVVDRSPKLYLWTELGALLHAKSVNTDQAWRVFKELRKAYFQRIEEQSKKKPLYLQRREANADREIDGMWSVIDFLDQLSHKVRFDLFDISEKSCPDGSYGKWFMRFLRGEIDCGIPLPPNFSLKQVEQHLHIVCLDPHCERKVNHFPNLIKGYAEEFWRSWYVPNKLEAYLKGSLPDGTPRCSSIDEVHRIMDAIVFPNKKRMR